MSDLTFRFKSEYRSQWADKYPDGIITLQQIMQEVDTPNKLTMYSIMSQCEKEHFMSLDNISEAASKLFPEEVKELPAGDALYALPTVKKLIRDEGLVLDGITPEDILERMNEYLLAARPLIEDLTGRADDTDDDTNGDTNTDAPTSEKTKGRPGAPSSTAVGKLMDAHGVTAKELSDRFDIPYRTVTRWRKDETCPTYVYNMLNEILSK